LEPVGLTVSARFTVPANPSRLVSVSVVWLEEPAARLRDAGLAEMLKSETLTDIWTELVMEPLVALMVTV